MADNGFSLADALSENTQNSDQPQQKQGWSPAPWGPPNPCVGPFGPGAPAPQPGIWPSPDQPGSFPGPAPGHPGFPQPPPPFGAPGPAPGHPGIPQPSPFGAPAGPTPPSRESSIPLIIPYERPLTAGVVPRLLITIEGAVKAKPYRFSIDLRKNDDIALHFNPRFDKRPHVIVRNTMINNNWGQEEKHGLKFPFEHGKSFKIQILCETDHFNIAVNNHHMFQYNYRIKELKEINKLRIEGDVTLTSVELTMA